MKTFVDSFNRTWSVSVNVATIKRVKSLMGLNLMEAVTGDLIESLKADPCLLVDVLYCVCKNEADAKGISDESFGEAMAGDAIENATDAFLDELIEFFPSEKKMILKKAFQKVKQAEKKALQMGEKYLEGLQIENRIEEKLTSIFNGASSLQE